MGPVADARTTVVIATRNRRETLVRTLDRIRALPERPPVVVADNGSEDGTVAAVRRCHPGVQVIGLERNLGSAARNAGVLAASTPFVAFNDDDSWWAPGALAESERLFDSHPGLGLIAAKVLVGPEERLDPTCAEMSRSELPRGGLPGPGLLGFIACGAVVRRSAFLAAGGFHERLGIGGEEELLALALSEAGHGLAYAEQIRAYHHPCGQRDPAARRRTVLRNGLWAAWLRRRPTSATLRTLRLLAGYTRDPRAALGALDALRGARWVLRDRRPITAELDRSIRSLG